MSKDNSGPAFPVPDGEASNLGHHGLSMRDWFAGQMLPHIATGFPNDENRMLLARRCYEIADAMLKAREA